MGSFTITNSIDVLTLQPYSEITGDLYIQAPGLTSIALPNLTTVGGTITDHNPNNSNGGADLLAFDLPALTSATSINLQHCPVLASLTLTSLAQTTSILTYSPLPTLDLPALASTATTVGIYSQALTSISAPKLVDGDVSIGTGSTSPLDISLPLFASGSLFLGDESGPFGTVDLGSLVDANEVTIDAAGNSLTLTALTTTARDLTLTGAFAFSAPHLQLVGTLSGQVLATDLTGLDLPAFQATSNAFQLNTSSLTSLVMPSFSSGGGIVLIMSGSASFPALQSLGSLDLSVTGAVSFSAPGLTTVASGVLLDGGITALDLTGLQSVGSTLYVKETALTTLDLPLLSSVGGLTIGWIQIAPCGGSAGGNVNLTSVPLPSLASVPVGNLLFGYDPVLPLCRAQALAQRLTGGKTQYFCSYAAGPCP